MTFDRLTLQLHETNYMKYRLALRGLAVCAGDLQHNMQSHFSGECKEDLT